MIRKHWRTCLRWSAGCAALIGVGVALYATLPPQPRLELRGAYLVSSLSLDGTILTAGVLEGGDQVCVSLKAWDATTGVERGEFFRGLIGSHAVGLTGGVVGGPGAGQVQGLAAAFTPGFSTGSLVYSPDGRYCALLHQDGMALADLHSGREWPTAVKATFVAHYGPEAIAIFQRLQQSIDTGPLQDRVKFRTALEYLTAQFGGKVPILVDREAFSEELGPDAPDIHDEEVTLPPVPTHMIANTALHLLLAQVGKGSATFIVRREFIEITTQKRRQNREVWPPVFSPGGSFVALAEQDGAKSRLHVVDCASGERIATLPADHGACADFAFTPDDELLLYRAEEKSAFTAWSTATKQIARTFPDIPESLQLAPDGRTLVANLDAFGVDLLDVRTGQKRRLTGKMLGGGQFSFAPDNRTLVRQTAGQLELWDVPAAARRCTITLGEREGLWPELFISADSRVICAVISEPKEFSAWSLESGARLWPPEAPPQPIGNGVVEVIEHMGLMGREEFYPRFTPDRRFLLERADDRVDLLDPAAAEPHLRLRHSDASPWILGFAPDGRRMLIHWRYRQNREPWLGQEWIAKWLPLARSSGCLTVTEVADGNVLFRLGDGGFSFSKAMLSSDGGTLLTSYSGDDGEVIDVWDVPGRPSLLLVVGIPLGIGCLALLTWWWFARRGTATQPNSANNGKPVPENT